MNRLLAENIWADLEQIRKCCPLIHSIANYVVMEFTADALLAIGASPVMAHAQEEVEEIVGSASSLVLNIGTLSSSWLESMYIAQKAAHCKNIPIILDPVGVGAATYRLHATTTLLQNAVAVLRGNASEIVCIASGCKAEMIKGVDSLLAASDHIKEAKLVAQNKRCVVSMSGLVDVVTDGQAVTLIYNGHPLMQKTTGMGCASTAISAAFMSVNKNPFAACVNSAVIVGICGEIAGNKTDAPGSFKMAFLDTLYQISPNQIEERIHVNYY